MASIRPNGDHDLAGPLEAPAGPGTGPHDDDSFVSEPLGVPSDEVFDHSREGDRQIGAPTSEAGRFRFLRDHAQGGIGKVSVAFDTELRREVASKQIKADRAEDAESRGRFVLEAEVTGRLEHPGIVPVYGLGIDDQGSPYYAMRFVRGKSLEEAIRHYHRSDPDTPRGARSRLLELRPLLDRFADVCHTVAYAHSRGVLHRDLKPANIMLGPFNESLVVDWGLAKEFNHSPPHDKPAAPRPRASRPPRPKRQRS